MKPIINFGIIVSIAVIITVVLFMFGSDSGTPAEKYCNDRWDCTPNACCHANDTVNKNYFPSDCAGRICTAECVPNTLDCAQGEIACVKHKCTVIWNE